MDADLYLTVGVLVAGALTLHYKSHVRFIALGLFMGLVLATTIGERVQESLASMWEFFGNDYQLSAIKLLLLLGPTLVLGINHSIERKSGKSNIIFSIAFVAMTTLFFFSSIVSLLPEALAEEITTRSVVAAIMQYFLVHLTVIVAGLIIVDSYYHKAAILKKKSKD